MTTTVTVEPAKTDVTVSSTDAISVDLTTSSTTVEIANGGLTFTGTLPSSPTFSGTVTAGSFTSSLTYQESGTSVNASTFAGYAGKRVVLNGTVAATYELPAAVSGDVGKTWIIHNASNKSITLDVDTNGQTVKHLTGAAVTPHTSDMTIVAGGVAELTCTAVDTYIIVGGGIS